MSDNHPVDPGGNTEAFRAFSSRQPEPAKSSNAPLIAGAAVVALALVALLIWLVVS